MLKRLTIKNFQAHESLEVLFDPLVTTFVGPSDAGKSAIIRALKLVGRNVVPRGRYVTFGKKYSTIKLFLDNGRITRRKGKGINSYSLGKKKFKALGTDMPEEIINVLRLGAANFQGQIELPYWFADSPAEVNRQLNAIVNLGMIDTTMANVAAELREARNAVEFNKDKLREVREQRKALRHVPEMHRRLTEVEESAAEYDRLQEKADTLSSLITELRDADKAAGRSSKALSDVQTVIKAGRKIVAMMQEYEPLEKLVSDIKEQEQILCDARKSHAEAKRKLDAVTHCPVCKRPMNRVRS